MKKKIPLLGLALLMGMTGAFCACSSREDGKTYALKLDGERYELVCDIDGATTAKVRASVTADGEKVKNPSVAYTVGDSAIAEVSSDGLITAKKAGYTTLTATYKKAETTVPLTVYGKATGEQVNGFQAEYVNLFGRNYEEDGGMKFDHVAAGVEVAIYGESFSADVTLSGDCYVHVFVDGNTEGTFKKLETKENFSFASGLSAGLHRIRVLKSSELVDGTFTLKNLSSEQFLTAPEKSDYKIEFIGDSLTTGYGAMGKTVDARTTENSDVCKGFAFLAAQELGVDFSFVALHGICVNAHIYQPDYKMSTMYPVVSPFHTEEYDFDDGVDMVVLSLGSNDAGYIDQNSGYASEFSSDYYDFLSYIREKRPNAKIVCTYGNGGKREIVDTGIQSAVSRMNDNNISYYTFKENFDGASHHPSLAFNKIITPAFVKYLREKMK